MAKHANGKNAPSRVTLNYQLLRTTTSPDETRTGVRSYVANLSAFEILKLGTKENLRGYIAEYSARKRNGVHEAIRTTIDTEPERFITRNSGFVIAASDILVDDNKKQIKLEDPSILNGAQSQGEIRNWIEGYYDGDWSAEDEQDPPFFVRAEIIVDPDPAEVVETAIARNTATPVKSISQAGARGHLDELEQSIRKKFPELKIRKKETDVDVFDTRKILQYTRLLMPTSVSMNDSTAERLRAYKNPEQCLSDFSSWYEARNSDPEAAAKYQFCVEMAPTAIEEYEFWEKHEAWNGQHVWEETKKGGRACQRDETGIITWISPGLIFPIMSAMAEFVEKDSKGKWYINKPKRLFKPAEMIGRTVAQFRNVSSDPMLMGRSGQAYEAVRIYPQTIVEVMAELKE
jgi:hypothetical protein